MQLGPDLTPEELLRATLVEVAPGTELRDALDRVIRGRTGALFVLGYDDQVAAMCSGGFELDVEFSAPKLRELAKMDGAVVLDWEHQRIVRAGVQLLPDATIETQESGTRHRTADRVAKQSGFPVISVSQSMQIVALYVGGLRHVLQDTEELGSRAKQAVATLERYRQRLDEVSGALSALEVEDLVTVRDAAQVGQRQEMVARIADEIDGLLLELGTEGRLLGLQYQELIIGVARTRRLLIKDYMPEPLPGQSPDQVAEQVDGIEAALSSLTAAELLELGNIANVMGIGALPLGLDAPVSPRGYRLVTRVPRIPQILADRIVDHFGSLQRVLAASMEDLEQVEGVTGQRARAIREGLSRIAETSMVESYA
ncbi:MAG: DNA integrity scanning diadenylate cyclase DisA [Bifidobacteriaceae bacterium]|jgi:diadenylate cyclase|nr:DNA integrity scanning diadenylate cyclase DisA [Bifidobacteriaceae bacterium]